MISKLKVLANRENAKRSTGPRTPAGKQRSSLNAVRHGLTGQFVVLPEEDMQVFQSFCQEYFTEWLPQGPTEKNLVQTLADQQWRLHRSLARERGIYALGHDKFGETIITENPEVHALLTAARVTLEQSGELDRMGRYTSRIQRDYNSTLKELTAFQAARKAREQAEQNEATLIQKLMEMHEIPWNPADDGFSVTPAQITQYSRRDHYVSQALLARNYKYNKKAYAAAGGNLETENPSS